ncbi:MAG: hypothetical protein MHPSP_001886, partial [Paramarteilia canceri]
KPDCQKVKKKKLNGFICFIREKKQFISSSFGIKESVIINMIAGKYWKLLDWREQRKYSLMAKKLNKENNNSVEN